MLGSIWPVQGDAIHQSQIAGDLIKLNIQTAVVPFSATKQSNKIFLKWADDNLGLLRQNGIKVCTFGKWRIDYESPHDVIMSGRGQEALVFLIGTIAQPDEIRLNRGKEII